VSQGLWELYWRGLKPLAGLTKLGTSQRSDQMKPSTWSSGLTTPPCKNKPVKEITTTMLICVVALCPAGDEEYK